MKRKATWIGRTTGITSSETKQAKLWSFVDISNSYHNLHKHELSPNKTNIFGKIDWKLSSFSMFSALQKKKKSKFAFLVSPKDESLDCIMHFYSVYISLKTWFSSANDMWWVLFIEKTNSKIFPLLSLYFSCDPCDFPGWKVRRSRHNLVIMWLSSILIVESHWYLGLFYQIM